MVRFSAETIPLVTVASSPSGAPMATTWSPTLIFEESANTIGINGLVVSIFITARSLVGSVPIRRAVYTSRRLVRTESSTLAVLPPIVTTWALVRM